MKRALIVLLSLLLPGAAAAQDVSGLWRTEAAAPGDALRVRVGPCGYDTGLICGVIEGAAGSDDALVGKPVLTGMIAAGPGRWIGGQVWVRDEGRTYPARMVLSGDRLTVEGCVAVFCKGQAWTRVKGG
ncbi:DUF2147 domain-containing protein [Oceanibium sediminis]|uniref:DUF2147 domain-containing protein n=1 Tax=Oceanibium sediminis TaxID=2026339 RepID=UPI000DD3EAA0|nr:DUF2147 domain-containing protein [Oceanibium sediminis]